MLHVKSSLAVRNGVVRTAGVGDIATNLADGDYTVLVLDNTRNRTLPQLKYLFGVVLKTISDQLPTHPPVDALYRYFEELYAPRRICNLSEGVRYCYFDLKNEKQKKVGEFIESVADHATTEWGIDVCSRLSLNAPEAKELWAGAYAGQWESYTLGNNQFSPQWKKN